LVEAFQNDGRIAQVGPDAQTLTPEYALETTVRRFEADYGDATDHAPTVVVALDLVLVKMPDHRIVGRTLATERSLAPRNSVEGVVEAFDVVVGKLLLQCVAWVVSIVSRTT